LPSNECGRTGKGAASDIGFSVLMSEFRGSSAKVPIAVGRRMMIFSETL